MSYEATPASLAVAAPSIGSAASWSSAPGTIIPVAVSMIAAPSYPFVAAPIGYLEPLTPGDDTPGWTGSYHAVLRIAAAPTQAFSGSCIATSAGYGLLTASTASLAILEALRQGRVYWLVEITATGISERYGMVPYASDGAGYYQGRVSSVGSWTMALADRRYALESLSLDCEVADGDAQLSALISGRYGNRMRNAAITLKLAAPDVDPADWYVAFSGLLLSYRHDGDRKWTLRMGTNDLPLDRYVPRVLMSRADWPSAAKDIFGLPAPIVLGVFDSVDLTDKGAVPTLRVDTTAGAIRYLVSFGAIKAVDRLYIDGVLTAAGWTFKVVQVGGKTFSVVEFASDPGEGVKITVDCQGWTTAGDGSGTVVIEPVAQLKLVLNNVVYGEWKTGSWLTTAAPIDESLFAEVADFLASSISGGHQSARYIGDAVVKGRDLIDTWATSFGIRAYWTDRGKLGLAAEDHRAGLSAAYIDENLVEQRQTMSPLSLDYDAANLLERVRISFLPDPSAGNFRYQLTVQDTSLGEVGADQFDAEWSRGHAS